MRKNNKYTNEFKKKVIDEYLTGNESFYSLERKYNISKSGYTLYKWTIKTRNGTTYGSGYGQQDADSELIFDQNSYEYISFKSSDTLSYQGIMKKIFNSNDSVLISKNKTLKKTYFI